MNSKQHYHLVRFIFLVAAFNIIGCSDDTPPMAEVSGTLQHKGKPIPNMLLTFKPTEGRPSWAQTDAAGKFTLKYSQSIPNGVVIGKHQVWLTKSVAMPPEDMSPDQYAEQLSSSVEEKAESVPGKYFSEKTSPVTIEIKDDETNLVVELP